ncbi:BTAD domain-containing putative transcriptional regulator [Humibacillus xanthopallidus]|uniref:AfsR/SARP family transcriptional regulator n=1 Tax=Humibacillus xanthopallidus TaxID=412689 RepID=UPI00384B9CB1
MQFRVLGPVEVEDDGQLVPLGSARERLVLAMLLLNADRLVSTERFIATLWDTPPETARQQLQNLIAALRRRLGTRDPGLLVTRPLGYQLHLGAHSLDHLDFRRHADDAVAACDDGDLEAGRALLADALSCWRGAALEDVARCDDLPWRTGLEVERRAVLDLMVDVLQRLGRPDDVLAAVAEPLEVDPFDERLQAQRLQALAASGRRAEALAAFRALRRAFVDDLGVPPGAELIDLHARILDGRAWPRPEHAGSPSTTLVPREAPARTWALTGRTTAVEAVTSAALQSGPPVVVIAGPGGSGKTSVAVDAAHRLERHFPDGTLWVRLGTGSPASTAEALARLIRSLGVAPDQVPTDEDDRIALYRSVVSGRRVLVVLDDATSEAQVRPLLPTTPGSCTLVTSRRKLSALAGAVRVPVPALDPTDSRRLLATLTGQARADAEPSELSRVADLCGHLPLALMVVGARLAANDSLTLADIRVRLERQHARLDELSTGDIDVRASILTSVESLSDRARALFQRLALTPTPEWAGWVAESLSGLDSWGRDLDELVDRHLVEPVGRDAAGQPRFRMHGLVTVVAVELQSQALHGLDDESGERLLAEWLSRALVAEQRLSAPGLDQGASGPSPTRTRHAGQANTVRPRDWFEVERDNLVATCVAHHPRGAAAAAMRARLALATAPFLRTRAYDDDRERILRETLAALPSTETELEGSLLAALFAVQAQRLHHAELPALAARQLALARRTGDRPREFTALLQSGWVAQTAHRVDDAVGCYEEAGRLAIELDDHHGHLRALGATGVALRNAGRAGDADPLLARTVDDVRASGQARDTCIWLVTRAEGLIDLGAVDVADELLDEASDIAAELGDELGLAHCRMARAAALVVRGAPGAADEVLALARPVLDTHAPGGCEPEVLRVDADIAVLRQDQARASEALARSVEIWRGRGDTLELARDLARLSLLGDGPGDAADPGSPSSASRSHQSPGDADHEAQQILGDLRLDSRALRLPPGLYDDR